MKAMLEIAEHVARQYVIGTQTGRMSKIGATIAVGVVFLTGCVFIAISAYFWLLTFYVSHIAALLTGLLLVGLSALVLVGLKLRARAELKKIEQRQTELKLLAEEALMECYCKYSDDATDYIKSNPKQSLLFAALAGFAASRSL